MKWRLLWALVLCAEHLWASESDKKIIHIQDIHLNVPAQRSISETLHSLIETRQVDLVAIEGAFGDIDINIYKEFPDQPSVHRAADRLLENNLISGPIHAGMTISGKSNLPFVGVEDFDSYRKNVEARRRAAYFKPRIEKKLKAARREINESKKMLNPRLRAFDNAVVSYREGTVSFHGYFEALLRFSDPKRVKKLSHVRDMRVFVEELNALEKSIYQSLVITEEEKQVFEEARYHYLLSRLINLSLTKKEWEEYKTVLSAQSLVPRHQALCTRHFEDFYHEAEKRDESMAKNIIRAMETHRAKRVALVAGGFHYEGLRRELPFSYSTVLPKIQGESSLSPEQWSSQVQLMTRSAVVREGLDKNAVPATEATGWFERRFWLKQVSLRLRKGWMVIRGKMGTEQVALLANPDGEVVVPKIQRRTLLKGLVVMAGLTLLEKVFPRVVHAQQPNQQAIKAQESALASAMLIDNRLSYFADKGKSLVHVVGEAALADIIADAALRERFKSGFYNVRMVTFDAKTGRLKHIYANERISAENLSVDAITNYRTGETYAATVVRINPQTGQVDRDDFPATGFSNILPRVYAKVRIDPRKRLWPTDYLKFMKFEKEGGNYYGWMDKWSVTNEAVVDTRAWSSGDMSEADIPMEADSLIFGRLTGMVNEVYYGDDFSINRTYLRPNVSDDPEFARLAERAIREIWPRNALDLFAAQQVLRTIDRSTERGRRLYRHLTNAWEANYIWIESLYGPHSFQTKHMALMRNKLRAGVEGVPKFDSTVPGARNSELYTTGMPRNFIELEYPQVSAVQNDFLRWLLPRKKIDPFDRIVGEGSVTHRDGGRNQGWKLYLAEMERENPNPKKLQDTLLNTVTKKPAIKNRVIDAQINPGPLSPRFTRVHEAFMEALHENHRDVSKIHDTVLGFFGVTPNKTQFSAYQTYHRFLDELNQPIPNWRNMSVNLMVNVSPYKEKIRELHFVIHDGYLALSPSLYTYMVSGMSEGSQKATRVQAVQALSQEIQKSDEELKRIAADQRVAVHKAVPDDPHDPFFKGIARYKALLQRLENHIDQKEKASGPTSETTALKELYRTFAANLSYTNLKDFSISVAPGYKAVRPQPQQVPVKRGAAAMALLATLETMPLSMGIEHAFDPFDNTDAQLQVVELSDPKQIEELVGRALRWQENGAVGQRDIVFFTHQPITIEKGSRKGQIVVVPREVADMASPRKVLDAAIKEGLAEKSRHVAFLITTDLWTEDWPQSNALLSLVKYVLDLTKGTAFYTPIHIQAEGIQKAKRAA